MNQEAAQGRRDSSGVFTLDALQAQSRLSAFRLREPSHWILKVVQAGVAAGARRVSVRLGRRRTDISLDGAQVCLTHLLRWLDLPLGSQEVPPEQQAARHLAIGLRAAGSLQPRQLEVQLDGARLELSSSGNRCHQVQPAEGVQLRFSPTFPTGWISWLRQHVLCAGAEHRLLHQRCLLAPIPIEVDGRPLRPEPGPSARVVFGSVHPSASFVALEVVLLGRDAFQLERLSRSGASRPLYRSPGDPRYTRRFATGDALVQRQVQLGGRQLSLLGVSPRQRGANLPILGLMRLPLRLEGPSRLTLVRHGVACEPHLLDIGIPGLEIFLVAPAVGVDLSEFGAIDSAELRSVASVLKDIARAALEESCPYLRQLAAPWRRALQSALPWLRLEWTPRAGGKKGPRRPPGPTRTVDRTVAPVRSEEAPRPPQLPARRPYRR